MNFDMRKRIVVLGIASLGLAFGACTIKSDGNGKGGGDGNSSSGNSSGGNSGSDESNGGESNGGESNGGESNGGAKNPGGSASMTDAGAAGTDATDGGAAGEGGSSGGNAGAADMETAAGAGGGSACLGDVPQVPQVGSAVQSASGAPSITDVYVSRIGQNMHIELDGAGFGTAPTTLPAVGYLAQFAFTDITQGSWSAGAPNTPVYMQFTSWTDARIVIDGFGTQYGGTYKMAVGDTVAIFVRSTANSAGGPSTTWTGTLKSTPPPPLDPDGPTPQICTATFSRIGQNMRIELDGAGFGTAPTTLPAVGYLPQFAFTDITQGGWSAGAPNTPVYMQFTSWTDGRIVLDGFGTQYGGTYKVVEGDAVALYIKNSSGPEFTTWTGKLTASAAPMPGPGPTPQVVTVTFDQVGPNMHIVVDGFGFGTAPTTLPAVGYLAQFAFTDITQGGWSAGAPNTPVYMRFTSWTDERIVIDGFGTQYGDTYHVATGDAVSLYIKNSMGPEFTIWTGDLP